MLMFLYIMSTIGMTSILVEGAVFNHIYLFGKSIRNWMESTSFTSSLFSCYTCTGFWAGLFCGTNVFGLNSYFLLYGFAGAIFSRMYIDLTQYLISKTEFEIEDEK